MRASKRKEKNRENKRKYIVRKRAVSEKKKRFWLKQSQSKWLAFIVTRCEECEKEKRRKR